MRGGLKIGRIFGINIIIDWSWIFIFLLITWNLGAGLFPQIHPDWDPATSWGLAVVAALLFFASILLHELAHSVVAKQKGLRVRSIRLFLFGGVSNIEREPGSAGTEFLMAVVGPLTSLALGVLFLLLGRVDGGWTTNPQHAFAGLGPVATLAMWLGSVNILLGIFNMIPAFPLDGGRVFRSLLWAITGNLDKATRWAARVGQMIAWLFIIGGISMMFGAQIPVFGTGFISGVWLAFIGWFLNDAAIGSYRRVAINDALQDVPVSALMRADVPTVTPDLPVAGLVQDLIMRTDDHALPVVEGGRLVGLVSLEDVRKVPRERWAEATVGEIMTPANQLAVVAANGDAAEAFARLAERDVRQVPVTQDGRLIGMLRRRDIVRWLQLHDPAAAA
jgi:Zn-dependent protease